MGFGEAWKVLSSNRWQGQASAQAGRKDVAMPSHDLHEACGQGPQSRGQWLQGVVAGATGLYWRDRGFTEISTAVHPISGLIQSETPVCLFPFKLQLEVP